MTLGRAIADSSLDRPLASSGPTADPRQRNQYSSRGAAAGRSSPGAGLEDEAMLPVYHDPHFTFRFADDRIIPRFHLEGVQAGRRVEVYKIDAGTGERLGQG